MNREKSVIDFYVLTNKLKNVIRTGWLNWHVCSERVESVAETIFGPWRTQTQRHRVSAMSRDSESKR